MIIRREMLIGIGGLSLLTTSGCLVDNSNQVEPTRPVSAPKLAETVSLTEELPASFIPIINQAEALAREFPDVFSDGATLRQDLTSLKKSGDLLVQSIPSPNPSFPILATVRPSLITNNGLIDRIKPQLYANPIITTFQPLEQVIVLIHEVSHVKDQKQVLDNLLTKLKGQPVTPAHISIIEGEIRRLAFQMESKELFKNCRQLYAIRAENTNFRTRPPLPFDQPLPNSLDRTKTLYSVYLDVKDAPDPENDPLWKSAIYNFVF